MVPIFPPWETSTLSTLPAGRLPAPRREARVAAVCGFAPRLRMCAQECHKAPRCANVRASPGVAQRIHAAAEKSSLKGRASIAFVWSAATPLPAFRTVFGQKPKPTLSTIGEHMKKDIKFSTRMASADREKIRALAQKAGMSMSDYVTACCLGKRIVVMDGLKEVLRQQKAIGNNLNQLAVLANTGKVQFANLDAAAQEFAKINVTLRQIQEGGRGKSQSSIS